MSYLLGRLELERVKIRLIEGEGWSLRKFHDWALSHGAVPWRWIEQAGRGTEESGNLKAES
jgi:uncharacterized protein (DUF885 family)